MPTATATALETLIARFDPDVFTPVRSPTRVRLVVTGGETLDAVLADAAATLAPAKGDAEALLTADADTWAAIAQDPRGGMTAFSSGRLSARRNLHLGIGFLAATNGDTARGRLRFRTVETRANRIAIMEAGEGPPVLAIHGLGGTKGSFLPTIAALAPDFRVIAMDQPGFGDSDKPIGAAYDPRFFARVVVDLLDALDLRDAHLVGNSLGGRVALEVALGYPDRVRRLGLLAPSLAWRRSRPFAPFLRLVRPELGLLQLAPRPIIQGVVHRVVPGATDGWTAAGVDEFLRAYLNPAGRAAFYAAARHIYLEEPHGKNGFWTQLQRLGPEALFVWGLHDQLVPLAFERHVRDALPSARHLELRCGHVPQVEVPDQTHRALGRFLAAG